MSWQCGQLSFKTNGVVRSHSTRKENGKEKKEKGLEEKKGLAT